MKKIEKNKILQISLVFVFFITTYLGDCGIVKVFNTTLQLKLQNKDFKEDNTDHMQFLHHLLHLKHAYEQWYHIFLKGNDLTIMQKVINVDESCQIHNYALKCVNGVIQKLLPL